MYDMIIVGGGPTGSALARLTGRNYKVLVLEKRKFQQEAFFAEEKCCGGLIAPDAQKMLAQLSLGVPKKVLIGPQVFSVRTIDFDHGIEKSYRKEYINIDRTAFDKWLSDWSAERAEVRKGCVFRSFEKKGKEIAVKFHSGGREYEERTKLLVSAEGANSAVRAKVYGDRPFPKRYIAIQEWYDTSPHLHCYGAIFDSEITDFYSWTIPEENLLLLGAALIPNQRAKEKFQLLKEKMNRIGFQLGEPLKRNGAFINRPLHLNQICTGEGNILLTGEAAGFISPSSAEGFSYAFRSAMELASALQEGIEGADRRYEENCGGLKRNILWKNVKSPLMYRPWMRRLAMSSGFLSLKERGESDADVRRQRKNG